MNLPGLIWDLPGPPPKFDGQVFHWCSMVESVGSVSMPGYVETYAIRLREKYLAFVHALGALSVAGKPVHMHLQDADGSNYWWMGLLAEKSPFKTPEIYQALRLLALEEILRSRPPCSLLLRSRDAALVASLDELCAQLQIPFSCEPHDQARGGLLARARRTQHWPTWLQAPLVAVAYLYKRWPLRQMRPLCWHSGDKAVLFCSYFAHLDVPSAAQGQFYSRQWGPLPDLLGEKGLTLNWLQNFWPGDAAADASAGVSLARKFNAETVSQGMHGFVDSYLSVPVVLRALRSWLFLWRRGWSLRGMASRLQANDLAAYLWPVLQPAWASSLYGRVGIANCISVHLFDAALRDIPRQARGFYLFENQAWEKAFLTAWRKYQHGHITGVVHATVPFWHLYYAQDPRSLHGEAHARMPLPDAIAVNGDAAREALMAQGFSPDMLVPVEALRYLSLARVRVEADRIRSHQQNGARVLIVGDMEPGALRELLGTVRDAVALLPPGFDFAFKPHPAYTIDPQQSVGLDVPVVRGGLAELLVDFDCVIAGNSTSACVDAFLAGKPVIIGHSGQYLNLSPLRGQSGVAFFESPPQLVAALLAEGRGHGIARGQYDYFYLDEDLTRWEKLLGLSQVDGKGDEKNEDGSDGVVSEQSF